MPCIFFSGLIPFLAKVSGSILKEEKMDILALFQMLDEIISLLSRMSTTGLSHTVFVLFRYTPFKIFFQVVVSSQRDNEFYRLFSSVSTEMII